MFHKLRGLTREQLVQLAANVVLVFVILGIAAQSAWNHAWKDVAAFAGIDGLLAALVGTKAYVWKRARRR